MANFFWNLRCMLTSLRYRREHETMENQYQWYKCLVWHDLESFFRRFKFWKSEQDELPF